MFLHVNCENESVTSVKFGSSSGASNTELSASGGLRPPLTHTGGSAPGLPLGAPPLDPYIGSRVISWPRPWFDSIIFAVNFAVQILVRLRCRGMSSLAPLSTAASATRRRESALGRVRSHVHWIRAATDWTGTRGSPRIHAATCTVLGREASATAFPVYSTTPSSVLSPAQVGSAQRVCCKTRKPS